MNPARVPTFTDVETLLRDAGGGEAEQNGTSADDVADLPKGGGDDDLDILRDMASGAPVVRAVNELFERAVEMRATDIHIEPFRGTLQVRLRVDGLLRNIPSPPPTMQRALISRVKILAGLNIAERRLPQDGRARVKVGHLDLDIRVATMPTAHGEAAILRVLERNQRLLDFTRLGFSDRDRKVLTSHLDSPHGMIRGQAIHLSGPRAIAATASKIRSPLTAAFVRSRSSSGLRMRRGRRWIAWRPQSQEKQVAEPRWRSTFCGSLCGSSQTSALPGRSHSILFRSAS